MIEVYSMTIVNFVVLRSDWIVQKYAFVMFSSGAGSSVNLNRYVLHLEI